jgi:hypothetical protein
LATYNSFELSLRGAVGELLDVRPATAAVVMSSTKIMDKWLIFSAAVQEKVWDGTISDMVRALEDEIKSLQEFRNTIVHGSWIEHEDGKNTIHRVTRPVYKEGYVSLPDLAHFLHRMLVFEMRMRFILHLSPFFRPSSGIASEVPYEPWRDKRLAELDHKIAKLGPCPTRALDVQPPASPRSKQARAKRPSSGDKRRTALARAILESGKS